MRLSVKIDTEEKKRRKSIRTKNLFAHHGSFSRLCLQYNLNKHTDGQTNKQTNIQTNVLSREPSLAILLDVHGHT